MITPAALLFAFYALASAEAAPPPPPRLCIGAAGTDLMAGRCTDAEENEIDVGTAEKTRSWIWIDSPRRTIALGTLAPDKSKIVIDDKPSAFLTVGGSAERGWPAATTLVIKSSKDSWKFTLPRDIATSLRAITVPDETYYLSIEAPRHLLFERRSQKLSHEKPAQFGRLDLKPVSMLRGRFIDRDANPVADVAITTPEAAPIAISDPAGFVHEELRAVLPPRLFVRRSGFGHRNIDVTRNDADFDFGTVTLSPGSTLTVNVDRNGYTGPLTASLIRPGEHTVGKRTTFETMAVKAGVSRIELPDVEARDYVLILRGDGPLQIRREDVKVGEHENAAKDIRLEPRSVKAFVHQGSAPVIDTNVDLSGGNGEWSSTVKTDYDGRFAVDAWQEGYVGISIARSTDSRYRTSAEIGKMDAEWNIDIPDRTIRGVVVDKETGAPVPMKNVSLRTVRLLNRSGAGLRSVRVDDDGHFKVEMVEAGQYEITAVDPAYLDSKIAFDVKPEDHDRDIRVEMVHGRNVQVKIVNADGAPVPNAAIIAPRSSYDAPPHWISDATGTATVVFRNEQPLSVWVVSPADAFAFVTIARDAKPEANRVVLPRASATVAVRTTHEDASPASHTHVLFAYNGAFVPDDVRSYFPYERLVTGSDGTTLLTHMPAGEYDFWTWETPEERVGVSNPQYLGAAAHVSILAGENRITLVVKPPKQPKK